MNIQKEILAAILLLIVSFARAQTVEYIHTDALGSPVAVTNASGAVIERTVYEPYGAVINRPVTNGPGYTGHVMDAVTGLNYMQQRYYDPQVGRFLSNDPVTATSIGGNFNRYWYANNNPYRFVDPFGMQAAATDCASDDDDCQERKRLDEARKNATIERVDEVNETIQVVGKKLDEEASDPWNWAGGVFFKPGSKAAKSTLEAARRGVAADAKFAQKTFGKMFSAEGTFASKSVEDVVAALRSGAMKAQDVPINYIVRDGKTIILNTRSAKALEEAGVPRAQWNGINRTGNEFFENLLNEQLGRNPGGPFDTVRPSGRP